MPRAGLLCSVEVDSGAVGRFECHYLWWKLGNERTSSLCSGDDDDFTCQIWLGRMPWESANVLVDIQSVGTPGR